MRSLGIGILLVFLASTKFLVSTEGVQSFKRSRKPDVFSSKQFPNNNGNATASKRQTIIIGPVGHSSHEELESSSPNPSDDPNGSENKFKIPQINFYNSLPNSIGVLGTGVLTLRELSFAVNTPLPSMAGIGPMVIFSLFLLFWPDLSYLGLPLFYPNGAEGDPLSAFPPYPDFDEMDLSNFEAIKTAIKKFWLIPPDWF